MSDKILKLSQAQTLYQDLRERVDALPTSEDIPEVPVQDVQVNGNSILSQGVANVPILDEYNKYGLPKIISDDSFIISNGLLRLNGAVVSQIKAGTSTYRAIAPILQHASAFYGLAKAAGADMKDIANTTVGIYPDAQKAAIQNMLGITDLISTEESSTATAAHALNSTFMMNGKLHRATAAITIGDAMEVGTNCEVVKADEVFVKNTDIANNNNFGVVKGNPEQGVGVYNSGTLYISGPSSILLKAGVNTMKPITVAMQHESTFYGLAKAAGADEKDSTLPVGQYTDTAKTAIRSMLGATSSNVIAVQDTQPTDTDTKIWLPETEDAGIEVPTYVEFQALDAATVKNVQVNGTTIVSNGVANIPLASSSVTGCIRVDANNGIAINSNTQKIYIDYAGLDTIKAATDSYRAIVPKYAYAAAFYGLAKAAGDTTQSASDNAIGTYTNEAKVAIRTMIGAASTARATTSTLGLVKIGNGLGITDNDGLFISFADDSEVKTGTVQSKAMAVKRTPAIAFYGLAKAAGDTTQAASDNAIGAYTTDASAAIRNMLGTVGTSDYANDTTAGVVKVSSDFSTGGGIGINSSGMLFLESTTDNAHQNGTTSRRAVLINKQHAAVFYGLAKAAGDTTMASSSNEIGTYTAEAKTAIHTMLGIDPASIAAQVDIPLVETVSGTTPTITGQPNVRYVCGEVSTITITPPASGSVDVIFESGSTATTMTVPSTVKWPAWFDAETLEANTTYEVLITDGIYGSVMTWAT